MKNYCIFAQSLTDPNDFVGMVERSFSFDWSKERVRSWEYSRKYDRPEIFSISAKEYLERKYRLCDIYRFGFGNEVTFKKEEKTKALKLLTDLSSPYFHSYGRSYTEFFWHWVNHYANWIEPPEGYGRPFVCRANSKYCPVFVDLSERENIRRKKIEYDKYNWRNCRFYLSTMTLFE